MFGRLNGLAKKFGTDTIITLSLSFFVIQKARHDCKIIELFSITH